MLNKLKTENPPKYDELLRTIPDLILFQTAADRLLILSKKNTGTDFLFGTIELVFHEGKLLKIEEYRRNRVYSERNT